MYYVENIVPVAVHVMFTIDNMLSDRTETRSIFWC